MITIPEHVLTQIASHRPHLRQIVTNLRNNPHRAAQFETSLAKAYLAGETKLPGLDTYHLAWCARGERFGGGARTEPAIGQRPGPRP